jgi:TolB-like protein/DNA-binding winged helix-turn-helix (wHTH) protein/cytochrome c-type biogenesis protein CcmH/NrfG
MLGRPARIGEWLVEPALDALRRGRETVHLEPKAMELLVVLASRPRQVVSREELLSTVWPGVVVSDEALSQAVTKLRKALGDDAWVPTYIETISKRGYRLIAHVEPLEGGAAMETSAPAGSPSRLPWRVATVGVLLALVTAGTYLLQGARQETASPAGAELRTGANVDRSPMLPTVTVAPFDSLSDDAAQVYLARGITADLTTDLSRLAGLRVIGASRAAGQAPEASGLNKGTARYVVSGSVQRAGDQLKINVRLMDSLTGQQLWSERYERALGDLFVVQDEIVTRLVSTLPIKMSEAERRRLARRYTRNLEAYDYFLRGQAALLTRVRADNERAAEMYRRALALDPAFARAYAGLALTHAADYRNQWIDNAPQALSRALELAETAFRIDPEILEVQWVLAYVHAQNRRHEQAISHLNQAIALDPSFADAYALLGSIHTLIGQPAKAIPLVRTAIQLNPEAGYLYFLILGRAYFFGGDSEQALINLREALSRNAANLEIHIYLAATLALTGDKEAAAWEREEIRVLEPGFSIGKWLQNYPMTDEGQKRRLTNLLADAGL